MSKPKKLTEVEKAKSDLEARSFFLELDRPIPEGQDIFVIRDLGRHGNRHHYKVAFRDPKDDQR